MISGAVGLGEEQQKRDGCRNAEIQKPEEEEVPQRSSEHIASFGSTGFTN
jgi:hypothetical protein